MPADVYIMRERRGGGGISDYNHVPTFTAKYLQEYIFIIIMYTAKHPESDEEKKQSKRAEVGMRREQTKQIKNEVIIVGTR